MFRTEKIEYIVKIVFDNTVMWGNFKVDKR